MTERLLPTEAEWLESLNNLDAKLAILDKEFRPLAKKTAVLLQNKLNRLDEILEQRNHVSARLAALEELYPDLDVWGEVQDSQQEPSETVSSGDYSNMKVWEAAREVLRKAGRPMHTREVADAVRAGGKEIVEPRTSKLNTAMRHKSGMFVSKKRQKKSVWSLAEWRAPQDTKE